MSETVVFDQASPRKLLRAILPTASDLEAFCLDYFPDVAARFASGQNRVDRENLLLQIADREGLAAALAKQNPRRFARYKRLLLSHRSSASEAAKNPYRGLSAFQVEEADLFFGRDELTERLWHRFQALYEQAGATRLLAVLGPSGSGKSSVARAGLLAELRTSPIPGPEPLQSIVLKPGDNPLGAVAIALLPPSHESATAAELSAQRDLADFLRKPNGRGEFDGLSQWAANSPDVERSPFVVLVDQFEEVYTLCTDTKEREAFVGVLLHAAAARSRNVSVVLTLRTDFIGETGRQHPTLNRLFGTQSELVTAMSREELRQAIAEPAAQAGQPIDDATVDLLLSQAWGNEGTLPLLEFALTSIWEGMQAGNEPGATLREIRGVGGALAGKAQGIFDKLDPIEQATARRALVRLVRLGEGTRDTRRRAPISELCGRGETETRVLNVLRKFATEQARLVTLSSEGAEPLAEVTHEALFDHWVALRAWIEQGRKDRGLYDRALEAAKLWQQAGRLGGRLWRPPDLDLLRDYQRRKPEDFGPLAAEFLGAAERRQKTEWALSIGALATVLTLLLVAVGVYVAKEQRIRQQLLDTYVERGRQLVFESGNPSEGLLWLHRAQVEGSTDEALPDLLASALHAAGTPKAVLIGHGDAVLSAGYSPDGRRIVTVSNDHTARVWDAESGHTITVLQGHGGKVLSASFGSDSRHIVTTSDDETARVWDADSGRVVAVLQGHGHSVLSATYSPDGRRIVTSSNDETARVWDAVSGHIVVELRGHGHFVVGATYSPDGRRIVTSSLDNTARVWDADSGHLVVELRGHLDGVLSATYSPTGRHIVTASRDKTARVWDADSGRQVAELTGHTNWLSSATYSPDGHHIVTAAWDSTARVWDADLGHLIAELQGHGHIVRSATYSPDGRHIVTASDDKTARLWDAESGRLVVILKGHRAKVSSATYSPDGRHVVTVSDDNTARAWEADSGHQSAELAGHAKSIWSATYSPDGRHIATASDDGTTRVWGADSGHLKAKLQGHAASIWSVSYSPDGRRIATASKDNTARVWDAESGRLVAELQGHLKAVFCAAFSPDGRRIVTASKDSTARVWDTESGRLSVELQGHGDALSMATYSPDGRRIVTASLDKTARVWDADSGRLGAELQGHEDGVLRAAFSPDGRRIVTASLDKTARVWDADSGRLVAELQGHGESVYFATFSPDGHRIVTTSKDNTARIWEASNGRLLEELRGHSNLVRNATFSPDGRRIITASDDSTARVWDADSGHLVAQLSGHGDGLTTATYSPDGHHILTSSADSTARVWVASPETRTPELLAAFIRCHLPVQFAPNNKNIMIPHTPTPQDCPDAAYSR